MLHQQLREATGPAHAMLEKKLIRNIVSITSIDDYVELLKLMYGYYLPVEIKLENYYSQLTPDIVNRRKSSSILHDISIFAPDENDIMLYEDTPSIDSYASALGALYVLEGSTLGGQIILKMLLKQLNLTDKKGFSFFYGYGENTQLMWEKFTDVLKGDFSNAEKIELIKSANGTFNAFIDWIDFYHNTPKRSFDTAL
jgi:heme oxygenase